jgi:pimeloyl-ACP methyl ester carboxylesterase
MLFRTLFIRLTRARWARRAILVLLAGSSAALAQSDRPGEARWWSGLADASVAAAGTNRTEWVNALAAVQVAQREGLQFLLEHMPEPDLRTLTAAFLLDNLALAYRAKEEFPWGKRIPTEVFLNDVLPYASFTERRDSWRKTLYELCAPLVKDCATSAQAAQALNQKLFPLVKVKYSTARKRPDQSPLETMESGIATCTGLSILLVDACRAVGVPARVAGTPMWANKRGNHTWVEIWDGRWHFTGAAEPDPSGLDRGWFVHDAGQALRDVPENAIYATSYRKTGLSFPLPWARRVSSVSAVNVTELYAQAAPVVTGLKKARLLVKVLERPGGERVAANVCVSQATDQANQTLAGTSRDESADTNDILAFDLAPDGAYQIAVRHGEQEVRREYRATTNVQDLVVVSLSEARAERKELQAQEPADLKKSLLDFFSASAEQQANWKFPVGQDDLLRRNEAAVRQTAWKTYREAPLHRALREDYEAKQVRFEKYLSPYTVKTVGTRPTNGQALFIAMHGGGNAPKEVNDSQWKVMQQYYHDHAEVGGYLYLALRAPNDTWNGFYDDYVYPLVANLVKQFLLFGDVDPNEVFLMGYSHGGYGAFAIGPKMPDRFAAVHASAAAPTDGETSPKTLRNTVFNYMIGEDDHAYGRVERCQKFNEAIHKLRGDSPDAYPVTMEFKPGFGHRGLPDRDEIALMYPAVRNPAPRVLTWEMTDGVIRYFYWLHVPHPGKGQQIEAACRDNRVTVTTTNVAAASILLDSRLVDWRLPVTVEVNSHTSQHKVEPSLATLCRTLLERGDPDLAFTAELRLDL